MHDEIQKEIDDLNGNIAELKQRAASLNGRERDECYKEIGKVENLKNELGQKIDEYKNVGKESWDTVKETIDQGFDQVKDGFKNIYARFKM